MEYVILVISYYYGNMKLVSDIAGGREGVREVNEYI